MTISLHFQNNCSQLAGKGKKLVTVFASCFSFIYRDKYKRDNSSTFQVCTRTANTAPCWLARRDYFSTKATGHVSAGLRHQHFLPIPAAVIGKHEAERQT
jgi:hypothetical protein